MSAIVVSSLISAGGFVLTVSSTVAIVSFKMGQFRQEQMDMKEAIAGKANLSDLVQIKESLAEIKGMFVLRLRE